VGVFAVYIKKETRYFGEFRQFGNTYHYKTAPGQVFNDQTVAEAVAELERPVTDQNVNFTGWTTWGPTDGTALANVIRASGDLTGPGGGGTTDGLYKEVCALVVIEIGRSAVLNRRRWLRKFLRMPSAPGLSLPVTTMSGSQPIPASMVSALEGYGNGIKNISQGGTSVGLCTEKGDEIPLGTPAQVRPFLFTRQIGE
jgi:hypothetical protein